MQKTIKHKTYNINLCNNNNNNSFGFVDQQKPPLLPPNCGLYNDVWHCIPELIADTLTCIFPDVNIPEFNGNYHRKQLQ